MSQCMHLESGTYMTLDDDWKKKLHCRGRHNIYCNNVITEQYTAGAKNCELAIVQNKTGEMREYCKMALVDVAAVPTKVHRIKNNKVLLENARGEDVYRKCMITNNKQFVTRDKLAELDIPCFCALQSDSMTTSLITSDVCIETPKVKLYDPLQNILFLVVFSFFEKTTYCCRARRLSVRPSVCPSVRPSVRPSVEINSYRGNSLPKRPIELKIGLNVREGVVHVRKA